MAAKLVNLDACGVGQRKAADAGAERDQRQRPCPEFVGDAQGGGGPSTSRRVMSPSRISIAASRQAQS